MSECRAISGKFAHVLVLQFKKWMELMNTREIAYAEASVGCLQMFSGAQLLNTQKCDTWSYTYIFWLFICANWL